MTYALLFIAGWLAGLLAEYLLHYLMHARPLAFHIHHHKEFFIESPRQVALNTIEIDMNLAFFGDILAVATVLMPFVGWQPVLLIWGGAFWHLVIVYEACHGLIHYDAWLPRFLTHSRMYRWWKACHFEHHSHTPTKNYCITCPVLDWLFGTYAAPRKEYVESAQPAAPQR
jgi:sterol desaturase/sphingolipid hydroxylase (fatty acid hydroxylase superfamily)